MQQRSVGWTVAATSLGFTVVQVDVSVVNVALARIGDQLHTDITGLQWVVDAYTVAFAALLLSAGTIGDRIGARRAFRLGFILFGLASLACSIAPSTPLLIVARAVQGIGAALLVPCSLALITHACGDDEHLRARSVAIWTASGGAAIAVGPVIGGFLIAALDWRSIFWINIPICALGLGLSLYHVPETPRGHNRHFDIPGQCLAILCLVAFTSAVIATGPHGLRGVLVYGGVLTALAAGIGFWLTDGRSADPMLPPSLMRQPIVVATAIIGLIINFTLYGLIFVLSLYFQRSRGYSPSQTGIAFLPLTALLIFSNLASGWLTPRFGYRALLVFGTTVAAIGYALLHFTLGPSVTYVALIPALVIIPLGNGLAVPAMTSALLSSINRQQSGTASAVLNTARQVGGAIGVALFGALVAGDVHLISAGVSHAALIASGTLLLSAVFAYRIKQGELRTPTR